MIKDSIECNTIVVVPELIAIAVEMPNSMRCLITDYSDVFQPPTGLRPRDIDR